MVISGNFSVDCVTVMSKLQTKTFHFTGKSLDEMASDRFLKYSDNFKVQLDKTLNTDLMDVRGCSILQDGRMILCCHIQGKIQLFNRDGSFDFEMNVGHTIGDIANMNENNIVALTSGSNNKISIVGVDQRKVIKTYKVDQYNYGLAVRGNSLIYCAAGKGIRQLDLINESVTDLAKCKPSYFSYLTTFHDDIYYTNFNNHTVTCIDSQGSTKWEFKNESVLKGPYGISVDNCGNVYVVGYASTNVVSIANDGKHFREVIFSNDKFDDPTALYYDGSNKRLLVAQFEKKSFLLNVE